MIFNVIIFLSRVLNHSWFLNDLKARDLISLIKVLGLAPHSIYKCVYPTVVQLEVILIVVGSKIRKCKSA